MSDRVPRWCSAMPSITLLTALPQEQPFLWGIKYFTFSCILSNIMFPGSQLVYQQALQSFVMSFRMRWDIVTLSLITLQHYSRRLVFQKCASQILLDIFFRHLCFFDFLAQMVEELSQSSKFFRSCSSHTHLLLFFDITFFRLVTLLFCYNPGCQPGINPEKRERGRKKREREKYRHKNQKR